MQASLEKDLDLYGFPISRRNPLPEPNSRIRSKSLKKSNARLEKWRFFLHFHSEILEKRPIPLLYRKKLRSRVRKGLPDSLRGLIWSKLSRISLIPVKFNDFIQVKDPVLDEISLDVSRTFPNHSFLKENIGKSSITLILAAISRSFPSMGYCQGLNFIAGTLSMFLDDEKSFLVLYSIIENYEMRDLYTDLTLLKGIFKTFCELMRKFLPKIFKKFEKLAIVPEIYATSWFLTFFVDRLPFETFLRIVDIFLLEERKIIYRIGLAILKLKKGLILDKKAGFEEIMLDLKNFEGTEWKDPDLLIKTANSFKFSKKWLKALEAKYKDFK